MDWWWRPVDGGAQWPRCRPYRRPRSCISQAAVTMSYFDLLITPEFDDLISVLLKISASSCVMSNPPPSAPTLVFTGPYPLTLMFVLCNLSLGCRNNVICVESEFLHKLL